MANNNLQSAFELGTITTTPIKETERIGFRQSNGIRERNDYYKFSLDEESDLTFTLDQLDQNANLEILDSDGDLLFSSTNGGIESEIIDADLEAGEYFARVFSRGNAQTNYQITASAGPRNTTEDDEAPGIRLGMISSTILKMGLLLLMKLALVRGIKEIDPTTIILSLTKKVTLV